MEIGFRHICKRRMLAPWIPNITCSPHSADVSLNDTRVTYKGPPSECYNVFFLSIVG